MVGEVSPQIMQVLNKECEAAKNASPVKAIKAMNNQPTKADDVELQDIAGLITTELIEVLSMILSLKNMNESNWKIRKAALDDLLNILKRVQGQIKPNLGIFQLSDF
jgi:hypothetical protein